MLDTLEHLEAAGIRYAGAGRNLEEAARPVLPEGGLALVAFTGQRAPSPPARTGRAPTTCRSLRSRRSCAGWRRLSSRARCRGQDGGVLEPLGAEHGAAAPEDFRRFARAVVDRADVYYGHSAHVFQGVEVYRGRPILYDTGDFIDDYAVDPDLRNDHSFLFRLSTEDGELRRLELFPVAPALRQGGAGRGEEREVILDIMQDLPQRWAPPSSGARTVWYSSPPGTGPLLNSPS